MEEPIVKPIQSEEDVERVITQILESWKTHLCSLDASLVAYEIVQSLRPAASVERIEAFLWKHFERSIRETIANTGLSTPDVAGRVAKEIIEAIK